jgi:hypothetical protein
MRLLQMPGLQPGDSVRYIGRSREAGVSVLVGTLGCVVAGPLPRRISPNTAERLACQVLFGYRTAWVPVEKLEPER